MVYRKCAPMAQGAVVLLLGTLQVGSLEALMKTGAQEEVGVASRHSTVQRREEV